MENGDIVQREVSTNLNIRTGLDIYELYEMALRKQLRLLKYLER